MKEAAVDLLGSLTKEQLDRILLPLDDDDQRRRWYTTPTWQAGLPLSDMPPRQQRLAHRLVATGLSPAGFVAASGIMGNENVLDASEQWNLPEGTFRDYPGSPGHGRGRDPLLYFVSVFGRPGDPAWGWRLTGHHLGLNYTIIEGKVISSTPTFFGANPAHAPTVGGGSLRILGPEEDMARELLTAFDPAQSSTAIVADVAPPDCTQVLTPTVGDSDLPDFHWTYGFSVPDSVFHDLDRYYAQYMEGLGWTERHAEAVRFTRKPKGIPAASMTPLQRDILLRLMHQYIERMPGDVAEIELKKLTPSAIDGIHFLWAGGKKSGEPCYYRVQGEDLLIEYDNVLRDANHAHSLWRDPRNDFGASILAEHHIHHHGKHRSDHDHTEFSVKPETTEPVAESPIAMNPEVVLGRDTDDLWRGKDDR